MTISPRPTAPLQDHPENRARMAFERITGAAPTVLGVAPGRVNLIGEHTDYNSGLCLPIAIPHRTVAAAGPRPDDVVRIVSLDLDRDVTVQFDDVRPGRPRGWSGYVAGTLWALREAGHILGGLDLVIASDVPVGAGLSSSAAIEGATAAAAAGVYGLPLLDDDSGRREVARACQRAENEIVGAPTGGLDQLASLLCREDHALLIDFASGHLEHVPLDLQRHGLELLVIDTRVHHALADGQYGVRRRQCERAAAVLGVASLREASLDDVEELDDLELRTRARHVVTENARVLKTVESLRNGDLARVGALFDASHASLRDDYEVSCAELDVACEAAVRAGALGARMTGGGFGGSAIALVPGHLRGAVATCVRTTFAEGGFTEPHLFVASAGSRAHVLC